MSVAPSPMAASPRVASATGPVLPRRFLAALVDVVVFSVLQAVVNGVFGVTRVTSGVAPAITSGSFTYFTTQTVVDWWWLMLLWVAYFAILEALFGASLGKALAGLRVTDLEGRRVTWQAAVVRNLVRPLDGLPVAYLLGGVLILTSRAHQRLGDRIAGTLVVPQAAVTSPPLQRSAVRKRSLGLGIVVAILLAFCGWFAYFGRPPLVIEGMKNTGDSIFRDGVSAYQLSSPRFGSATVTYPIRYRIASTDQACQGELTLQWNWSAGGWVPGEAQTTCTPRIYP